MATPVHKMQVRQAWLLKDPRPVYVKLADYFGKFEVVGALLMFVGLGVAFLPIVPPFAESFTWVLNSTDFIFLCALMYYGWADKRTFKLPWKIPATAGDKLKDPNNPPPGKGGAGKAEGILYMGTCEETGQEIWVSNNDARTHFLYLGTTGAGKTEGLKSLVSNALTWGSGFVYVDGKADTDLWASLYALARRFGRDDDLLILNYMTGNSDDAALSNTMNPFANGSSSFLANMIISLMPDAGGDNAMWKERATALMFALMPALTYMRDHEGLLMDIGTVRDNLELGPIIKLSRNAKLPERIIRGLQGYLQTLPGYIDAAFDDDGNEKPPSPDQPMYDLQVARQQHGYLSMQFTRSLQSLADEYHYIFKAQLADIDVIDVVLNRRILIVLIPALEKALDEAANLGKIVVAGLKGMMGSTLGASVEGSWEEAIGTKQTRSANSYMTVFDEVGYYTAPGMNVMAAQARSLGFSLVFAAQDLAAMERRVKQEARSIVGNCNIKIFGKIEDPLDTKDFLDKHAGHEWVMETKGYTAPQSNVASIFSNENYMDDRSISLNVRQRISYDHLRKQREGQAYIFVQEQLIRARLLHCVPEKTAAMRVHRFLPVPGFTQATSAREKIVDDLTLQLKDPDWTAETASPALTEAPPEFAALNHAFETALAQNKSATEAGAIAVGGLMELATQQRQAAAHAEQERIMLGRSKVKIATSHPLREGDEGKVQDIIAGGHFGIPGMAGGGAGGHAHVSQHAKQTVSGQPIDQVRPMVINPITGMPEPVQAGDGLAGNGGDGISAGAVTPYYGQHHAAIGRMAGDWSVIKRKEIVIEAADLQLPPHLEDAARERGLGLRRRLFGDTSR